MQKDRLKYRKCGKIISIVILLSFLKPCPMSAQQQTEQPPSLNENETRYYSDLEIELLIDEISEAALEAIEQAAGEAARAAVLAILEREAAALRESQYWRMEAEINLQAIQAAKQAGRKNTLLAVLIGVFGGLAVGVGGTLIIGGK